MNEESLPDTGSVEVVEQSGAAELVEDLARDTADDAVSTERLLIALDIDGTVILEDESLSPGIVDAVEHARTAGHEVMLATGRSWDGTERIMKLLELAPEFVVCSNGAVIMAKAGDGDDVRYERAHTETFDATEVLEMLRGHLGDARYMVELADGRRLYTEYLDDWNLHRATLVPFEQLAVEPVCRVVVVAPEQGEEDFLQLVERIGLHQVSYSIGWTAWLDIAPQGVDKSTALEMVRDWLAIDAHQVLVIGDGRNDVGMMAWALENGGRAVAMAQGPQEVLDAAGEHTTSVHEGGVAAILRAL